MNKINYKKLDRRNNGHEIWKYYVNRPRSGVMQRITLFEANQKFYEWRNWCWETWGPSKEITDWLEDQSNESAISQNQHWSWQRDKFSTRIYLRNDEELTFFKLRWSGG